MQLQAYSNFLPVTPGQRFTRLLERRSLLKLDRLKKECFPTKKHGGRNHTGKITVRHRGGGHKQAYRTLDFGKESGNGLLEGSEYDPNRNANIFRLFHPDLHQHKYLLGVKEVASNTVLRGFQKARLNNGHVISLRAIPLGYVLHNLSTTENKKGQYLRSAGTYGQLLQKTKKYAKVKLRSGEHKLFSLKGSASLGTVSCEEYRHTRLGKAGRKRYLGFRPKVRGVAINPVDHPHGGGEGRTSGGRPSVTPWGKPTKGQPTSKKKKKNKIS